MFTGIITATAPLVALEKKKENLLTIRAPGIASQLKTGDSLAVSGICLTLAGIKGKENLQFHLSRETLSRSNLADLAVGSLLNLELPLRLGEFLSGHWVTGHVDGTARLRHLHRGGGQNRFAFTYLEREWRRFLVAKGSVALNGISLTLVDVEATWFSVEVIPMTWQSTNLRFLRPNERVNIELDFIGKYLYNFSKARLK